jgi:hypothetical protein
MNRWLTAWVMAIVIATVVGLWLREAGARAQQGTIGDTLPVPDFDGTFTADADLAGNCLKFDTAGDPNTYLCPSAADEVTLTCGGADVWVCTASGCTIAGELGAVTSLDATTESTVEAAVDTLANLTSVQGQSISLSGSLTVEAATTTNQDLTTDANVEFNQVTVGNNGLVVGSSIPFADAAGTLTLQNVDALDATTESTIEAAIDTLPNLRYPPGSTITCSGDAASVDWSVHTSGTAIVDFGDEGAAGCTITFSNVTAGFAMYVKVIQDGDGGNATWAGCTFHWGGGGLAPTITAADNSEDNIMCFSFDGSVCDCTAVQDYQ